MKYPWQDSGHAVKFVANYPHAAGNTEGAGRKMSSELVLRLSCHGCTTVGGHAKNASSSFRLIKCANSKSCPQSTCQNMRDVLLPGNPLPGSAAAKTLSR